MFLTTGTDIELLKSQMPEDVPNEIIDAIVKSIEYSSSMDITWRDTYWDSAKDIANGISDKEGLDIGVVMEAVSLIEEASKIDYFENMPWLGYSPIDPCCGNFCLTTGHSGKADTPDILIIPRFIAYDEDGQVEFDWVEDVGDFENCSFNTLVIPKSVMFISKEFSGCDNFERIIVDERNPRYSSDEQGLLYSKHKTVLCYCPNAKTSIMIPKSVRRIDDYFLTKDSKLREIIVEEGNPVFHVDEDGRLCDEKGPIEFEYYDE
jgi:hypothetical protein